MYCNKLTRRYLFFVFDLLVILRRILYGNEFNKVYYGYSTYEFNIYDTMK